MENVNVDEVINTFLASPVSTEDVNESTIGKVAAEYAATPQEKTSE